MPYKGTCICCSKEFFSQVVTRCAHTKDISIQDFLTPSASVYSNILHLLATCKLKHLLSLFLFLRCNKNTAYTV